MYATLLHHASFEMSPLNDAKNGPFLGTKMTLTCLIYNANHP